MDQHPIRARDLRLGGVDGNTFYRKRCPIDINPGTNGIFLQTTEVHIIDISRHGETEIIRNSHKLFVDRTQSKIRNDRARRRGLGKQSVRGDNSLQETSALDGGRVLATAAPDSLNAQALAVCSLGAVAGASPSEPAGRKSTTRAVQDDPSTCVRPCPR